MDTKEKVGHLSDTPGPVKHIHIRVTGPAESGKTHIVRDLLVPGLLKGLYLGVHEGRGMPPAYTYTDEGTVSDERLVLNAKVHIHIDVRNNSDAVFPCDGPERQPCVHCGEAKSEHHVGDARDHSFDPIR